MATDARKESQRLAAITPERMTPDQHRVYETIISGPRGRIVGPLAIWLHRPELGEAAQALGRYCRFESSLPGRLRELAILVTARAWGAEFEWWSHKPLGLEAGLSEAVVEAIRAGDEPAFVRDDEAVVYSFASELHRERSVCDGLYRRAVDLLGEAAVIDLTGLLGYYTLVSMTLNVFQVELPKGVAPELDEADA